MKKKIALLLLLALTLSMLFVLTSCGECKHKKDEDGDYYCDKCEEYIGPTILMPKDLLTYVAEEENVFPMNAPGTELSELTDFTIQSSSGNLVLFTSTNYSYTTPEVTYKVLNVESGTVVLTKTVSSGTANVSLECGLIKYSSSYTDSYNVTTYNTEIYDANGSYVANADSQESVTYYYAELYKFDGKLYTIEDGVPALKFDKPFVALPGDIDDYTNTYYYDESGDALYVYNTEFALVTEFFFPMNAEDTDWFVLNNNNVFAQSIIALPDDAESYDVYMEGTKYDVKSYIINAENGEATYIDFAYIVDEVTRYSYLDEEEIAEYGIVANSFTNLVELTEIVDKTLSGDEILADLNDNMEFVAFADQVINAQNDRVYPVAEDRYIVSDDSGKVYLVDGNGNMIGEVTGADNRNGEYFLEDGKYYDTNLNYVADVSNYERVGSGNGYVLYRKPNYSLNNYNTVITTYSYYLFRNGTVTELTAMYGATNVSTNYEFFSYRLSSKDYTMGYERTTYTDYYCNIDGQVIASYNSNVNSSCYSYGDALVIAYNVDTTLLNPGGYGTYTTTTRHYKIVK